MPSGPFTARSAIGASTERSPAGSLGRRCSPWKWPRDAPTYSSWSHSFHIEVNHAHTFWGLQTRLDTKLAAHTLCLSLNRLHGVEHWLQVKHFALAS